jgi:RPA family protein
MANEIQKRQIAYKVLVKRILDGEYIKEEGWTPNYIIIDGEKVSRINIVGVIVSINEERENKELLLEDKSGRIPIRIFEQTENNKHLSIGDIVTVIGRPREYGEEKYVVPEIIKKVEKGWLELRLIELREKKPITKEETGYEEIVKKIKVDPEEIIRMIKTTDKGEGADYEEIVEKIKDERTIRNLLEEGEIFEIKPGKLKIL